jgi:hypothetical protein
MAKKQLRIGLIGYSFMGRAHSNAFHQVNHFFPSSYELVPQAVCGRDAAKTQEFADKWGYKSIETDWKKLIARDDIDVIDIATPNNLHAEQVIAAAKAGRRTEQTIQLPLQTFRRFRKRHTAAAARTNRKRTHTLQQASQIVSFLLRNLQTVLQIPGVERLTT